MLYKTSFLIGCICLTFIIASIEGRLNFETEISKENMYLHSDNDMKTNDAISNKKNIGKSNP
jgi:hypothetical protein